MAFKSSRPYALELVHEHIDLDSFVLPGLVEHKLKRSLDAPLTMPGYEDINKSSERPGIVVLSANLSPFQWRFGIEIRLMNCKGKGFRRSPFDNLPSARKRGLYLLIAPVRK